MSAIANIAELYLWNNLRMYLLTRRTCLLDNILEIADDSTDVPIDRYTDLLQELDQHIGLGSYQNTQPTQFSRLPYITVNIQAIPSGNCNTRVVMGFDVAFTTDTPDDAHGSYSVGNSNEAVAAFRANIMDAFDELMYDATDIQHYDTISFFDALREQTIINPVNPTESKKWAYNLWGQVDGTTDISEVTQLKREDRSSGISVFSAVYTMDINRAKGNNIDCGC